MKRSVGIALSVLMVLGIVLAACAPAAAPTPVKVVETKVVEVVKEVPKEVVVTKEVMIEPTAAPDRIQITWYIGLGAGAQPAQIPLEKAFVEKYNKSQSEIQLIPVIVDNKYARDNLTAQLAAGNAPDIVGPVGTAGRAAFPGSFLDLQPLIAKNNYNTGDIDAAFLNFYKVEGELVGLPFAIFPSATYLNVDLFKEAGLALPPQKVGDKYTLDGKEVEWDFNTVAALARKLTVDKNGNDATQAGFDAKNIVQWGDRKSVV